MITSIHALASGDDVFVVWQLDAAIVDCVGFAVFRQIEGKDPVAIDTWVGFEDEAADATGRHKPSTAWPVQKTSWTDYLAPTAGRVRYGTTPVLMTGPKSVAPSPAHPALWSDWVTIGGARAIAGYFNRGTISAQWLQRAIGHEVAPTLRLLDVIKTVGNPIRDFLGGLARERLIALLDEAIADPKRTIFAALFELNDPELITKLSALGARANVVLGNSTGGTAVGTKETDDSAAVISGAGVKVTRRAIAPGRYAHNKFVVFCDGSGVPKTVWTGSTNWTQTGVCTQNNNGLELRDDDIARDFRDHWGRLHDAGKRTPDDLVADNDLSRSYQRGQSTISLWFTPTSDRRDLARARALINGAKQGVVFLMLNPGPDGLLGPIIERSSPHDKHYDPDLYIRGVLNNFPNADGEDSADDSLSLLTSEGDRANFAKADLANVLKPVAIDKTADWWAKEIANVKKFLIAVHSKVIVLDPAGDHPVVMTGSHNFSSRASSKNDDNLVIIEGDATLAAAYAVNVVGIYNQYRWQQWRNTNEGQKDKGLKRSGKWLEDRIGSSWLKRETRFWVGG